MTQSLLLFNSNIEKCKLELVPTGVFCPLTIDIPENIMDRLVLKEFLGTIQNVIKRRVEYVANS